MASKVTMAKMAQGGLICSLDILSSASTNKDSAKARPSALYACKCDVWDGDERSNPVKHVASHHLTDTEMAQGAVGLFGRVVVRVLLASDCHVYPVQVTPVTCMVQARVPSIAGRQTRFLSLKNFCLHCTQVRRRQP
jgi:hypothetical protein